MQDLERYAWQIAIQSGQDYQTTLNEVRRLTQRKGQGMVYKIGGPRKAPANREQRRRFMRILGLSKGATKKRTASLKAVR